MLPAGVGQHQAHGAGLDGELPRLLVHPAVRVPNGEGVRERARSACAGP